MADASIVRTFQTSTVYVPNFNLDLVREDSGRSIDQSPHLIE